MAEMNTNDFVLPNWNTYLAGALQRYSDTDVLGHFFGFPIPGLPGLDAAAAVCIDMEWWSACKEGPKLTTEIGISELMNKGIIPSIHAQNILRGIRVAHARVMPNAHLFNNFPGAGDPEDFRFGTSMFVTLAEAKQVLVNTFVRPREGGNTGELQPIVLIGHAIDNEFEHIQHAFGVDLLSYGTIVKVIDTQAMARKAGIKAPKGPNIGLKDLLAHFNVTIPNMHSAGNDAAGNILVAVLLALKDVLYPGTLGKPLVTLNGLQVQHIVSWLMGMGKVYPSPPWGRKFFCTRCDRFNHVRAQCHATVQCSICRDSGVVRLYNAQRTHATSKCLYQHLDLPPRDHFGSEPHGHAHRSSTPQFEEDYML